MKFEECPLDGCVVILSERSESKDPFSLNTVPKGTDSSTPLCSAQNDISLYSRVLQQPVGHAVGLVAGDDAGGDGFQLRLRVFHGVGLVGGPE